jgi:hypothetical protein
MYNQSGSELLTLVAGSTTINKRRFKAYELAHQSKKFLIARRVLRDVSHIETGKGIRLGMNSGSLKHILGEPTSTEQNDGATVLHYSITDASSPFLQRFKASSYNGDYTFTGGGLTNAKVAFGDLAAQ